MNLLLRLKEWNILSIEKFLQWILSYSQPGKTNKPLLKILILLAGLNLFFVIFSVTDFYRTATALDYEKPSLLYGLNNKNQFEPIAEFYRFSKIIIPIKKYEPEEDPRLTSKNNKIIQSFQSMEDNHFYSHIGIDFKGIARAFVVNLIAGRVKEGASTITQQVSRLKFLSTERTILRKAREAWLALLLEAFYNKDTIMEMYLNEIPLGHGTIGVGAASRFYFRKDVNELTWGETAILSSLTTSPKSYSPISNPENSRSKVKIAIMKLVENGKLDIKTAEKEFDDLEEYYISMNRSPNDSAFSDRLNRFPYFTEYIRKKVMGTIGARELYSGGYKIYSTLNIKHQESAEKALYSELGKINQASRKETFTNVEVFDKEYGGIYDLVSMLNDMPEFKFKITRDMKKFILNYQDEYRDELSLLNFMTGTDILGNTLDENFKTQETGDHLLDVEGSIISIRPDNGYITAIVGGSSFRSDNQQIRSFQAYRQPGSAFKPILVASALDYYQHHPDKKKNITAATLFLDSPIQYLLEDGDEWQPENYSEEYAGFITLRKAIQMSKNTVAIRLLEHVGISNLLPYFKKILQINDREIPSNFSVSLGSFELTPFELTRAYAVFASGGKTLTPLSVLYIKNADGKIIQDNQSHLSDGERVISSETAFIVTSILKDVIKEGTGKRALAYGSIKNAAGKTGTTNNYRDAWFVGYTPELVSSVWLGYDTGTVSLGRGMAGGAIAAPIWGRFMVNALVNEKKKDYPFDNVEVVTRQVCKLSGKIPGASCVETYEEYFTPKTIPEEICNDHSGANEAPTLPPIIKKRDLFKDDDKF